MNVEIEALKKNKTWELVHLPIGKRPIGCKWVYGVKYKANGTLERYKARLVAKGYTQTYNMDYLETFALVSKMNTIKFCYHWQQIIIGIYNSLMLKMHF